MKSILLFLVVTLTTIVSVANHMNVDCKTADGQIKTFQVRYLYYNSYGDKEVVGVKSGPNRQDDGLVGLQGDCVISLPEDKIQQEVQTGEVYP